MSLPVTVYLDSQDYSRFGDVLRGKGDAATKQVFDALLSRKASGQAIFAVSMPILGELLQYDAQFRDTTLKKAEAVELLCGPNALAFPSRVVAREVALVAQDAGLSPRIVLPDVLSNDRFWYPNIGDALEDFKASLLAQAQKEVSDFPLPNRNARRAAKKLVRKFDVAEAARLSAPEMADKFGLPVEAVSTSIVALLKGKISSEEASKRLFSSIAEPQTFVELYFERLDTDRSLPSWIRNASQGFTNGFTRLKAAVEPFMAYPDAPKLIRNLVAEKKPELAALAVTFARESVTEFGVSQPAFEAIQSDPMLATKVPSSHIVANAIEAYTLQIVGVTAASASIEHSFAGDMVHALYLPYVDLWRGDRRFSEALIGAMPTHKHRVVRRLTELPAAIDAIS